MTETMECDVLIIGAGPAGLSAAIRLKQLNADINVIIVEKGSEVGAHILSGAVFEPRALNELIPDWKEKGAPLNVPVTSDAFSFLTKTARVKLPTPPQMHNHGNYIISLGNLCRWLAGQAEGLGVQIFPGFPAADTIIEDNTVKGVRTGAFGVGKNGEKKDSYQEPMELRAKLTLFGEGCRGSNAQKLMKHFNLREGRDPQTYGIGIKELWQVDPAKHKPGHVEHTIGWPMNHKTYGGSFVYHLEDNQVYVGFVVGLDYENPWLDPFKEFQRFKEHPHLRKLLEGGKRISYGARALNEGGWQSIPKLTFPGGALIGCAAGFLNVPKIKGSHTAMKSGMLAAEAAIVALRHPERSAGSRENNTEILRVAQDDMSSYETALRASWVGEELYAARNIRPGFHRGLIPGLIYAAIDTYILRGKAKWTFKNHADHKSLKKAAECKKIEYAAPDGVVSFDRMSSVYLSNTNHEEDQPCHLTLKNATIPVEYNLHLYAEPAQRYCPAGVYEIVEEAGISRLQINAQNCVHCKTCDIKDPTQNIVWVTPEGGGGPNYPNM